MRRSASRAVCLVIAIQCGIWTLVALFGFTTSPWTTALAYTQAPGLLIGERLGWCCGIGGGFMISDDISNQYGGLSWRGALALAGLNTLALGLAVTPVPFAVSRIRRRVPAS